MTNSILLQDVTTEQLVNLVSEDVRLQLEQLKKDLNTQKQNDNLLTRDEACEFLKVNSSTLWAWTNKGRVKAYAIGARRYYKRSELIGALTPVNEKG